jgi:hypothetical protein
MKEFPLEVLTGAWAELQPHFERGAVFLITPEIDLVQAGQTVTNDEVDLVKSWLARGQMVRPTPEQVASWSETNGPQFDFVIVAPYVLIQLKIRH